MHYLLDPLRDESEHARRAAVEVLNEVCDGGIIKGLFAATKDSDWWVKCWTRGRTYAGCGYGLFDLASR